MWEIDGPGILRGKELIAMSWRYQPEKKLDKKMPKKILHEEESSAEE
jgi:hypothetical protein